MTTPTKEIDLFSPDEKEQLQRLDSDFYSTIVRLSDDLYSYQNYLLPVNHFEASVLYYKYGICNVSNPNTVVGKAIIDAGAFIGDSALVLSSLKPDKIYAFEAIPENYRLMLKTIELNSLTNVVPENIALNNECKEITMHVRGPGSTAIERKGVAYAEAIQVKAITLDQYVKQNNIQVGLIKVDIEGGEPSFLLGAKETICSQRPILLLSIYHNAHDFFELKPMIESWNVGYKFKIYKPIINSITTETLLIAEVD